MPHMVESLTSTGIVESLTIFQTHMQNNVAQFTLLSTQQLLLYLFVQTRSNVQQIAVSMHDLTCLVLRYDHTCYISHL